MVKYSERKRFCIENPSAHREFSRPKMEVRSPWMAGFMGKVQPILRWGVVFQEPNGCSMLGAKFEEGDEILAAGKYIMIIRASSCLCSFYLTLSSC